MIPGIIGKWKKKKRKKKEKKKSVFQVLYTEMY
jgi:hypothetical protein